MLKEVTDSNKSVKKTSTASSVAAATPELPDYGVREQIDPDTDTKIPVVYGEAFLGGNITDAAMTVDKGTMYYCITLSEMTGVKLSTDLQSVISFEQVFWNQNEIQLASDGKTAASFTDEDGTVDTAIAGLIEFYFYSGNSTSPVALKGHVNPGILAHVAMLNWTSEHAMNDLVFCIIKVSYNREAGVTGLGRMEFKLKNTMSQPGDCLYDYMVNTRYGAGLPPEEINS